MTYPKEELESLAAKIACLETENQLGLPVLEPPYSQKTRKVGAAITWEIYEDSTDRRKLATEEFRIELSQAIASQAKDATGIVLGSINVFHDPTVHKCAQYGMYGWVEVY